MVKRGSSLRWPVVRLGRHRLDRPWFWAEHRVQPEVRRRAQVRRILPDPIQAAFEGGIQRRNLLLAIDAESRQLEPAAHEEEFFYHLLKLLNHFLFGGNLPFDFEFLGDFSFEDMSPEVALVEPDMLFRLEPWRRGRTAVVRHIEANFDPATALQALAILEWSRAGSNWFMGSLMWILLSDEDRAAEVTLIHRQLQAIHNGGQRIPFAGLPLSFGLLEDFYRPERL